MIKWWATLLVSLGWACGVPATAGPTGTGPWQVKSPDGALAVTVRRSAVGALSYTVQRGAVTSVAESPLGLTLAGDGGDFTQGLTFEAQAGRTVTDKYDLPAGKSRHCTAHGNETTLRFRNAAGREVALVLRAYDDGVAFQYRLLGAGPATVRAEASAFHITAGTRGWVAPYRPNYESFYPEGTVGHDFTSGDIQFPALFDVGSGLFTLLTESGVGANYCSAHLAGSDDGVFRVTYPDPEVAGTLPWATPWRVVITGTLAQVVQSTLVETLAAPTVRGDTRWVKPGRVAWSWWSQGTGDLTLQKHYVDFAHAMGWEYDLVDGGWSDWNHGDPGPQIQELVQYARARGVGILVWCFAHDLDTPEKRAARLPVWKNWGVAGFKADFFDSDSHKAMQLREDILRDAWQSHLLVNFHGDQTPRGQERMWPNFLTREGVRGAEYHKFGPYPTPAYNCTLPYTRNVPGPMDYTPVTFSTSNRKTTAAHELALSVVFQSGGLHLADSPEAYNARPVAEPFLKEVPVAWDETRFLDGYPAQYACLARRHGDTWFVGMNNAGTARTVSLPLAFLGRGDYRLELYHDGPAPDSIEMTPSMATAQTVLQVSVPANGGFAARLVPARAR